ncbi:AAA family ATPase [Labrenzia sp. PHM005]|uniref:AAA family ATPase n=1 Tax=Labrenzia sp. PHM005 TaxID=2590016 RepID=UPI0011401F04|nr:AAA family ATPase [Labrenzia sp. PHM005]QDG74429.1 ATP-binding protein [Labrenzia sp. PHM005]
MTTQSHPGNRGGLAPLKNVARCLTVMGTLRERGPHLPGIGVFHGYSGYGKTYAAILAQHKTDALRVEVGDSWTKKTLLQKILKEAEAPTRGTIADLTEQVILALGDDPDRPLIIDEADKLADKGILEIVREVHDHSHAPILLIGEELLPTKIQKVERVHNRVLHWEPAEPCDREDAEVLARYFAPDLSLSGDLIDHMVNVTSGLARRINVNLERLVTHARRQGLSELDIKDLPKGFFFTGEPPRRIGRRAA